MRILRLLAASVLACLVVGLFATAALAQEGSGPEPDNPGIEGETINPNPNDLGENEGDGGVLPFTGADITLFVVIGLAAIGTGTLIVRRTRSAEHQRS
jgi:LPXTG-motif cell wall-anchored protein